MFIDPITFIFGIANHFPRYVSPLNPLLILKKSKLIFTSSSLIVRFVFHSLLSDLLVFKISLFFILIDNIFSLLLNLDNLYLFLIIFIGFLSLYKNNPVNTIPNLPICKTLINETRLYPFSNIAS